MLEIILTSKRLTWLGWGISKRLDDIVPLTPSSLHTASNRPRRSLGGNVVKQMMDICFVMFSGI